MSPIEWGKDYLHVMLASQNPNDSEIVMDNTGSSALLIDLSKHDEVVVKNDTTNVLPIPQPAPRG